jgi:hypothetical protein
MTSDRFCRYDAQGFEAALEKVKLDADDEAAPKSQGLHTLNHVPELWSQTPYAPCTLARSYEHGDQIPDPNPVSDHATVEAVSRELALDAPRSTADLLRLRRAFALLNHPDLVPQERRAQATTRMALANFLIDREIRAKALTDNSSRNSGRT